MYVAGTFWNLGFQVWVQLSNHYTRPLPFRRVYGVYARSYVRTTIWLASTFWVLQLTRDQLDPISRRPVMVQKVSPQQNLQFIFRLHWMYRRRSPLTKPEPVAVAMSQQTRVPTNRSPIRKKCPPHPPSLGERPPTEPRDCSTAGSRGLTTAAANSELFFPFEIQTRRNRTFDCDRFSGTLTSICGLESTLYEVFEPLKRLRN